jgi:hypothetical protein
MEHCALSHHRSCAPVAADVRPPKKMGRLLKSVLVGTLSAVAACVLALASAPWFDTIGFFTTPAAILLPVIGPIMPSTAIYSLIPEGGAPAAVLVILSCALLFWAVIFGAAYFTLASVIARRSNPTIERDARKSGARPSL